MMAVNIGNEEGQKIVAKYQPLVPVGEGHGLSVRSVSVFVYLLSLLLTLLVSLLVLQCVDRRLTDHRVW